MKYKCIDETMKICFYLNKYAVATFEQDDYNKKVFNIYFYNEQAGSCIRHISKTMRCSAKDGENRTSDYFKPICKIHTKLHRGYIYIDLIEVYRNGQIDEY